MGSMHSQDSGFPLACLAACGVRRPGTMSEHSQPRPGTHRAHAHAGNKFGLALAALGIVYGDTENEHLKIAAFILLFASFIIGISGLCWNFWFFEDTKHRSIIKKAYGGYAVAAH